MALVSFDDATARRDKDGKTESYGRGPNTYQDPGRRLLLEL